MPDIHASLGRPDMVLRTFGQLTWPELLILDWKLRHGKRRALQVAAHSGSLHQIWDMIRLINELADGADDVNRALSQSWPT